MHIYDTKALYNQNMSSNKQEKLMSYYKSVFSSTDIKTIHDCSIGAGGTTLPLAKLGYKISGSDISDNLLNKAKENFNSSGFNISLQNCDFRSIAECLSGTYDCIISTGNSLPHINNEDVDNFVCQASKKINPNGYLYIDIRNWDKLLKEKPTFNAFHPMVMNEYEHKSLYQFFNWYRDSSVEFIFVTSVDKKGKHESHRVIKAPTYYPLTINFYEKTLNKHGFKLINIFDMDSIWNDTVEVKEKAFIDINWYGVLAQKL